MMKFFLSGYRFNRVSTALNLKMLTNSIKLWQKDEMASFSPHLFLPCLKSTEYSYKDSNSSELKISNSVFGLLMASSCSRFLKFHML